LSRSHGPSGILDWSAADRCLVGVAIVLPLIPVYWWGIWRAASDATGYVDTAFAGRALWLLPATYGAAWVTFLALALVARRVRPDSRLLVHLFLQLFALWGFVSWWLGHLTSVYTATMAMSLASCFMMFEPRPVLAGVATFLAIVLGTTLAERLGWIPYAPLMATAPYAHGRLADSWFWGVGGIAFVSFLVSLLPFAWMVIDWQRREDSIRRAATALSAYVPPQLAERILEGEEVRIGSPERRRVTVVFSDVAGFTELADRLAPEELSTLLNEYLAAMAAVARDYGATLNQIVGDGLMVILGAPETTGDRDDALRAVRMALGMQGKLAALRRDWEARGFESTFHVRMALTTGYASVGNFGAPGRVTYTAIGTQTNLAARIQADCPPDGVLLGHSTWALVKESVDVNPLGERSFKGLRDPVAVYDLRALREGAAG